MNRLSFGGLVGLCEGCHHLVTARNRCEDGRKAIVWAFWHLVDLLEFCFGITLSFAGGSRHLAVWMEEDID